MKKKIEIQKWLCKTCNKLVTGNRYANPKLLYHECQDCTPYLKVDKPKKK